jgi:hypothetical protein
LEELCRERNADGPNLKERIKALGSKVVLPQELLQGLDDLRLLGNDAAHIESQEYAKIGREEVEVGVEFTKEVLKAVYQYSALLSRLRALKKPESAQKGILELCFTSCKSIAWSFRRCFRLMLCRLSPPGAMSR